MDSRLAADPVARHILDLLTILENAAGVRAHYRILDSPPLVSIDASSVNTVARVLSDWIGLRNAVFHISVVGPDQPANLVRTDPDHEEFALEVPSSVFSSPEVALSAIARQVARAYLITSNIGGGSVDPKRTSGRMADVTAIFLGMGKMLLNAPVAGVPDGKLVQTRSSEGPLSPEYLAFTHRIVCSMRGLDWNQHTSGMNSAAISLLRQWDPYRDTVFSQALRNVLTAAASHRPLTDAIEDNHLALARYDQLKRAIVSTVLKPLDVRIEEYHKTCREGMERLGAREQDTYDPCLLFLNQLRRRMDLQRYADMLLVQQEQVLKDLRVLTSALGDLNSRKLVHVNGESELMQITHCPFDGTPISIHESNQDARVRCANCGYGFLATSGLPQITALKPEPVVTAEDSYLRGADEGMESAKVKQKPAKSAKPESEELSVPATPKKRSRRAALCLIWGFALMPLAWMPMLVYFVVQLIQGKDAPLVDQLGRIGLAGSGFAIFLVILGSVLALGGWMNRRRAQAVADGGEIPAEQSNA